VSALKELLVGASKVLWSSYGEPPREDPRELLRNNSGTHRKLLEGPRKLLEGAARELLGRAPSRGAYNGSLGASKVLNQSSLRAPLGLPKSCT